MHKLYIDISTWTLSSFQYMRTTLNIDDDILQVLKQYADSRALPIGKAASELVRRGLAAPCPTRVIDGVVVFDLPKDSPKVTSKRVKELESESL